MARKRIFSIIYVPDQDREPKSFSLSYTSGRVLLIFLGILSIYIIMGGVGFYRLHKVGKTNKVLSEENEILRLENKKIEKIAEEFKRIRLMEEKINKAFGQSLGLGGQGEDWWDGTEEQPGNILSENNDPLELTGEPGEEQRFQNNLYFIRTEEGDYYNPEYLPTMLPVEGFLTTHFQKGGWFTGHEHLGIDIAAEKGSVIRASGSGVVILANWTHGFGNVVIINHGNGLYTYYAHAMQLLVSQGQRVKRGHPIALLGSSGISSAPHLHFEIWKNGKPLDPEKYLYAVQSKE
ncbi:MAG: M23 family metallopeptidase [bacterium]